MLRKETRQPDCALPFNETSFLDKLVMVRSVETKTVLCRQLLAHLITRRVARLPAGCFLRQTK